MLNEKKYLYKKDALTDYFKGKLSAKELDKIAKDNFGVGIATKKELSSFLSNKFTQDVMSDTYGIPSGTLVKRVRGLMKFAEGIGEDTDVGHQDDEPNMLKSTALEIMEYGKKLMDKLDKYDDMEGEVDFPNWWQSKLTLAKDYLQKAYHYLDSEEKTSETIDRSFRTYDDEGDDEGPVDEQNDSDKLLQALKDKLSDEGGAAGFKDLQDKAKEMGVDLTADMLKGMDGISQHRDGDYILDGFASDAQRRAAFASGYKAKGKKGKKKKNEAIGKPTISKPFKSNDRTFDKVYNTFDKRDYFNSKGLAKTQIGNFERALKKNDKGAQQILNMFKGDMGKAKDYITQVISDRNKERAFNNYKAMKSAVDSFKTGKPNVGAVDYVKRIIHNSSQKYSIALYSALRNKKFTKWKDVHNDIDSLVSESVNEGKVDSILKRIKSAYDKSKNKKLDIKKLKDQLKTYKKLGASDKKDQIKAGEMFLKSIGESVNENRKSNMFYVLYQKKGVFGKPAAAGYKNRKDAEKFAKSLGNNHNTMILDKQSMKNVKGVDIKEGMFSTIDQIRRDSKNVRDFVKNVLSDRDFAKMKNDKDFIKYLKSVYEGVTESKTQINQLKKKVGKKEIKFYDALSKLEKKMGSKYKSFLDKSLKDFKLNPSKFRTNADKEEKLFQVSEINTNEDLRNWFKSKWVNIGKKDKSGKHPPCGTSGKKRGYAKCVPAAKAATMSKKEKESATRRKRAAQNKAGRGGSAGGGGRKPINVSTHTKRSGKKSGTGKGS